MPRVAGGNSMAVGKTSGGQAMSLTLQRGVARSQLCCLLLDSTTNGEILLGMTAH